MANATTGQAGAIPFANADPLSKSDPLQNVLADLRDQARDQLAAAWQLEIERVQEQLAGGWQNHLHRVFEERFAELSARLSHEFQNRTEAARVNAAVKAQRDTSNRLNQAVRRFRTFENEEDWGRAFVDATEGFSGRAALFTVNGGALRLTAGRAIDSAARIDNTPLESAPAFAGAIESRDTIVALRTRGELSGPIADVLGEAPGARAYLLPIALRDRIAAVLYADSDPDSNVDASALELLAAFASAVLEGQSEAPQRQDLVSIEMAPAAMPKPEMGTPQPASHSSWYSLGKDEQELHIRAQRFARVQVAEMRLYKSQAVRDGRLRHDLYEALREDIDRAQGDFRRDFLSASPTMVDYLHLELLRTLANDNVELLGAAYPGPMV